MTAHIYTDQLLVPGTRISLPPVAARHVQVLRFQPGNAITLFNGLGPEEGQYAATIESMGRSDVQVMVGTFAATRREAARAVHLQALAAGRLGNVLGAALDDDARAREARARRPNFIFQKANL